MIKAIRDRMFPSLIAMAFVMTTAWALSALSVREPDEIIVGTRIAHSVR